MSKKTIGIPGYKLGENSFGCHVTYLDFASKFGNAKIIMPTDDVIVCDAVILPGGPDVAPASYGEPAGFFTTNSCLFRQGFVDRHLDMYVKAGIPVFGICLGFQMLNTHFGGKLTQHVRFHPQSKDRYVMGHEITIMPNAIFMPSKKKDKAKEGRTQYEPYEVNSHHHQVVTQKDLANTAFDELGLVYNHDDPGNHIVEAFVHKSLPISGVQWHPEEIHDEFAYALFNHILNQKKVECSTNTSQASSQPKL